MSRPIVHRPVMLYNRGTCECGWPPIMKQRLASLTQIRAHVARAHVRRKRAGKKGAGRG